jgi:hypothetical protein
MESKCVSQKQSFTFIDLVQLHLPVCEPNIISYRDRFLTRMYSIQVTLTDSTGTYIRT